MTRTCACGCGQVPPPAPRTQTRKGWVKGEPLHCVPGHQPRGRVAPPTVSPVVTREALYASLQPPNACRVKAFLEQLDADSRAVVEEALGYDSKDYPASALRNLLLASGFREADIPGNSAIQDHRQGRRPCRCKG